MSDLVDHLAELTGHRDRDVLDATLVAALREMLGTRAVTIYRSIGEPGEERWLTRARLVGDEPAARADPPNVELDDLPLLASHPARHAALRGERLVELAGASHTSFFPVASERQVVGVLEIETAAALKTRERRMVTGVLRIFRNVQGLLDYGERDSLTGLLNRKTFDETFLKASAVPLDTAAVADERRDGAACGHWLGIVDIDHFKNVNDSYGHLIGDEVLLLLARLMRGSLRATDRLYRFGGEEFVALVRCRDAEAAALAFERLRANTERQPFPQIERITVSVGFTEVRAGDTPSGAFERADKAVYYAKGHGRNQVQHHEALVARGELASVAKANDVELF